MPRKRSDDDIPIKIGVGGWNGKFVVNKPQAPPPVPAKEVVHPISREQDVSQGQNNGGANRAPPSGNQFHGYRSDPEVLPVQWDGTFAKDSNNVRYIPDRNASNETNFFGYNTEPTILPTEWSGTFVSNPNDVRYLPDRNRSDDGKFFAYNTEPTVLPVEWSGKFEKDPSGVYYKPERNRSNDEEYYKYNTEPTVLPPTWDGKFQSSAK